MFSSKSGKASVEAYEPEYPAGSVQDFPVSIINDLSLPWEGTIRLRITKTGGSSACVLACRTAPISRSISCDESPASPAANARRRTELTARRARDRTCSCNSSNKVAFDVGMSSPRGIPSREMTKAPSAASALHTLPGLVDAVAYEGGDAVGMGPKTEKSFSAGARGRGIYATSKGCSMVRLPE